VLQADKRRDDDEPLTAAGAASRAAIHWYEAHGVGKRGLKIKRFLD